MSGSKPVLLIFHDGLTSPRWSTAREQSVSCRSSSGLCLDCDHEPKGPGGGRVTARCTAAGRNPQPPPGSLLRVFLQTAAADTKMRPGAATSFLCASECVALLALEPSRHREGRRRHRLQLPGARRSSEALLQDAILRRTSCVTTSVITEVDVDSSEIQTNRVICG